MVEGIPETTMAKTGVKTENAEAKYPLLPRRLVRGIFIKKSQNFSYQNHCTAILLSLYKALSFSSVNLLLTFLYDLVLLWWVCTVLSIMSGGYAHVFDCTKIEFRC